MMLEVSYKNALTEVDEILKYTQEDLIKKIPESVKQFIMQNKNNNYLTQIVEGKPLAEQKILPETEAILSLFYRNYWATEEEKEEFKQKDAIELTQIEAQKAKEINPIFKERKQQKETVALVVQNKENWFQKIWKKLCKFFT